MTKSSFEQYDEVAKGSARKDADRLESIHFPRELVEKALELAQRQGYVDGRGFKLNDSEPQ